MTTRVVLPDGREATMQIVDKTRPIADKDYQCAWGHDPNLHTIKEGDRYVRIVYKLHIDGSDKGVFSSDHICFNCWNG